VEFIDPERIHPEIISKGSLVYPDSLKSRDIHGIVQVKCLIDTFGNIKEKSIYKSTNPSLNNAALETISNYKFKSGEYVGQKVESMLLIPRDF
jgi:TonB family protein